MKQSVPRKIFLFFNYTLLLLVGILCILPFVNLLAVSFSSSGPVGAGKVYFCPVDFNLDSYRFIMNNGLFFRALFISIERCILGVGINLIFMVCYAYPMSKSKTQFRARKYFLIYFLITYFANGGLIPTYILISNMGLLDSI